MNASARTPRPLFIVALLVAAVTLIGAGEASAKKFVTEDGNVSCIQRAGFVRCDVTKHKWPPTPKPKGCEFDFGSTFVINEKGKSGYGCVSDATGATKTYGAGTKFQTGENVCRIRKNSKVHCVNKGTGSGFDAGKKSYELF